MNKKAIIAIVIIILLVIIGCVVYFATNNNNQENQNQTTNSSRENVTANETNSSQTESQETTETPEENTNTETGKTLVVYFSAQNHTEAVAQRIAENLNADIFEITPVDEYTSADLNWNDDNSRVTREHEDESLRNVELTSATVENWDSYDTIFIGYPIWWGIAAWPTDSFVEANDFTGKTVIPFCTSASSGLGESGELLAELAGTGDWQEGMRFRSSASESDVSEWIASLGL